jgi:hypothetical protein
MQVLNISMEMTETKAKENTLTGKSHYLENHHPDICQRLSIEKIEAILISKILIMRLNFYLAVASG